VYLSISCFMKNSHFMHQSFLRSTAKPKFIRFNSKSIADSPRRQAQQGANLWENFFGLFLHLLLNIVKKMLLVSDFVSFEPLKVQILVIFTNPIYDKHVLFGTI
jgi:hypothetical protein